MVDLTNFEVNGFDVGVCDIEDIIKGKENDYINACTELWDYLTSDEFLDSPSAEKDYIRMTEPYEHFISNDNILIPMECLDDYCYDNSINVSDFLDNMNYHFKSYDDYFVDSSQYVSGNILADFELDMTEVCKAIINRPYDLVRFNRDIEDEKLLEIIAKMRECVNLED